MTLSEIKPLLERMTELNNNEPVTNDAAYAEWKQIKDRLNEGLVQDGFQVVYNSGIEQYSLVVKP